MQPIIQCKNLTHYYGKRLIYENLSFEVPQGQILGLLGKNGTGKTTTINILNGYLKPRSGQCFMFGEDIQHINPITKRRIALLIEGHVQYSFMNTEQLERFYAPFYPKWNKDAYYELIRKLKITPRQRLSQMSCGQRSQVALGLILAQNADLLILDDFSMGLDPGYRRLFIDYLRDYAKSEQKTVFLTSHIIQDMEKLIDDCIILDYGKILVQQSIESLMNTFRRYTFTLTHSMKELPKNKQIFSPTIFRDKVEIYSFASQEEINNWLAMHNISHTNMIMETMNLEDIFIGLTGKY